MDPYNKPVLIYVSKEKCPACDAFDRNHEWDKIKASITDANAIFVKFVVSNNSRIPDVLTKRDYYYPMIILVAPRSYFSCFTHNDQVNPTGPIATGKPYTIKGFRYNVVEDGGKYTWAGRQTNATGVIAWFNKMAPEIPKIDDNPLPSSPPGVPSTQTHVYPTTPWQMPPQVVKKQVRFNLPPNTS